MKISLNLPIAQPLRNHTDQSHADLSHNTSGNICIISYGFFPSFDPQWQDNRLLRSVRCFWGHSKVALRPTSWGLLMMLRFLPGAFKCPKKMFTSPMGNSCSQLLLKPWTVWYAKESAELVYLSYCLTHWYPSPSIISSFDFFPLRCFLNASFLIWPCLSLSIVDFSSPTSKLFLPSL